MHYERWRHRGGDPTVRLKKYTAHGMSNKPEYRVWHNMKQRCLNPNHKKYSDYGGRGITVYEEWINDFATFYDAVGERPHPKYSLDRIDNDGNYEPGNVRWTTVSEQNKNRRKSTLTKA